MKVGLKYYHHRSHVSGKRFFKSKGMRKAFESYSEYSINKLQNQLIRRNENGEKESRVN